jgi:hypothetical protein
MEGQGYSHGSGKYSGTTKSTAKNAPMDKETGNTGKAIGDTGRKNPKGNRDTKCDADRYKGS